MSPTIVIVLCGSFFALGGIVGAVALLCFIVCGDADDRRRNR